MKIESNPGTRKAARRFAGQFQRTFRTPLNRLPLFTEILLNAESPIRSAFVLMDTIVFMPRRVADLLAVNNLSTSITEGSAITANGPVECRALLTAALSDAIDFYFVPDPKRFLLYADHDEYTTVYTHSKGRLAQIADALKGAGVKEVVDFQRSL
jgi:hypothetical protein